jgi:HPt (histidine-containing phosphotransfer) domain-containing protein
MSATLCDRESFCERIGDDEETFHELVDLFLDVQPAKMDLLAQAIASDDYAQTRIQAHALAGTFRNMSLDALGDCAKRLEHAAAGMDVDIARGAFLELDELFARALSEMENLRGIHPGIEGIEVSESGHNA